MTSMAGPVATNERIYTLDVIRGCALLGIFIMNMPWFGTSFYAEVDGSHQFPEWWNRGAEITRDVLFSGKFNSMFSMLFAIGFTLQLERLEQREPNKALSIYSSRIFWLFIFGIVHACVFWTGDILHWYALLGVVLLLIRRVPDKVLWALFAACFLYPVAVGIYRILYTTHAQVAGEVAVAKAWEFWNNRAYGHGTFIEAALEHMREMIYVYTDPVELRHLLTFYLQIFSTMIVGLILGRHHFFQKTAQYLPAIRRVQWWALALGILTGVVFGVWQAVVKKPAEPTVFKLIAQLCFALCRVSTMAFYVATIIRAVHSERWRTRLAPMAKAGRMPLTNYLMQTLIGTFIFYGWGLGWWGKIGPAADLALAIGIFFIIQVPFSYWWLKRFELGPMEYLWRRLTYGRAPPLRVRATPAPSADGSADAVSRLR